MQGTVVGVLRGGPSREHDVSLATGHAILSHLAPERFIGRDIYIDKKGEWFERGRVVDPVRLLHGIDVAIVGLHGEYGENGQLQRFLDLVGTPYTGADSFGSFLAMHKVLTKEKAKEVGLRTPEYRFIERNMDSAPIIHDMVRSFLQPVVVKPIGWGSSVGVSMAGGYAQIHQAVEGLRRDGAEGVLLEEFIRGREATAGVVEGLRGEELYALPPVEIIPPEGDFFSYGAKYSGATRELCPAPFSRVVNEDLMNAAKLMHRTLNQKHYSRSDFIVTPRGIYFLETNSAAAVGLTPHSLLPKALATIGISFRDFLTHLIDLALGRHQPYLT